MLEKSRALFLLETKKKPRNPTAMRGHVNSRSTYLAEETQSFYWSLKSREVGQSVCQHCGMLHWRGRLTHGNDTLQPPCINYSNISLRNAYFTQMAGLWICGPGFMMRGGAGCKWVSTCFYWHGRKKRLSQGYMPKHNKRDEYEVHFYTSVFSVWECEQRHWRVAERFLQNSVVIWLCPFWCLKNLVTAVLAIFMFQSQWKGCAVLLQPDKWSNAMDSDAIQ